MLKYSVEGPIALLKSMEVMTCQLTYINPKESVTRSVEICVSHSYSRRLGYEGKVSQLFWHHSHTLKV
jgi:hypothetical protein